jgi:hypothetical protein
MAGGPAGLGVPDLPRLGPAGNYDPERELAAAGRENVTVAEAGRADWLAS